MIAGSDTGKGLASSLTEMSVWLLSWASSARRVGSARAAKVRSRVAALYLTILLSVGSALPRVKRGRTRWDERSLLSRAPTRVAQGGKVCKRLHLTGKNPDPGTDNARLETPTMAADTPRKAAIAVESASKLFLDGAVVAFHDLSLDVGAQEILCIVGPSGCGKTTLLRCIAGLAEISSGSLTVNGTAVAGKPPEGVAMVFQHFGLLPWKTVWDNAAFGLTMAGAPAATIRERVSHYLSLAGLAGFEQHYPYQLSGGMQQRVGLVRALAMNPSVLLMDEPFAALDAQTREILQEELLGLMQRPSERKAVVFITHSIDEAILLGDRVAVMTARPGRIKEILDMPWGWPRDVNAVRADRRFAELRAHIWDGLRPARLDAAAAFAAAGE